MAHIIRTLFKQRPADTINILFLLFLLLLSMVFYSSLPKPFYLIIMYAVLTVVQVVLIQIKDKGRCVEKMKKFAREYDAKIKAIEKKEPR